MVFELKTNDPSGSGYVGTLRLEERRINTDEPPYPEVRCIAIEITGWSVWKRGNAETAFLSAEDVAMLRDALNRYLATGQYSG